jgi:hypothetical protein
MQNIRFMKIMLIMKMCLTPIMINASVSQNIVSQLMFHLQFNINLSSVFNYFPVEYLITLIQ